MAKTPPKSPPIKSGFCSLGNCEGTKPKSPSGKAMKTCEFWLTCSCSCHKLVTQMFEIAEQPRIMVSNPEYKPAHSPFWMPSLGDIVADRTARSNAEGTPAPPTLERPGGDATPPVLAHVYAATPTGRAARGELETQVNQICTEWVVEKYSWYCTPTFLSEKIGKQYGISPPSTGAITACLERWVALGFAKMEKKPTRFTGYTDEAKKKGLAYMKEQARRNRQVNRAKQKTGMR